jgi:tetratricopeptide (TPR) repeat protein
MNSPGIRIALAVSLTLTAASAEAAQSWRGAQVMPKSEQLQIEAHGEKDRAGTIYDLAWPATVEKSEGRWLFLRDEGGYSNPPVAGWVYADDVLTLEDAARQYTSQLEANKSATVYWLRGICWENKNESLIALSDYRSAEMLNPNLDDVQIRMGRILARRTLKNGTVRYRSKERSAWEQHFASAQRINPERAQLYMDWGIALSQACKCGVTATQARVAAATQGEQASDTATQTAVKADAADAAATVANTEINALLKTRKAQSDAPDLKARTKAFVAGGNGGKAQDAADAALSAAKVALDAAMHAMDFGAKPLEVDGDVSTIVHGQPEYTEEDIATAEQLWKGSTKYLQSVNLAREAATIARQAAKKGWKEADNAFTAYDNFPQVEPTAGAAPESLPSPSGIGPAVNAEPFVGAGQCFEIAKTKSPNWWRIPVAQGEFLLNQCAVQTPEGETGWNEQAGADLLKRLVAYNSQRAGAAPEADQASAQPADPRIQSMELAVRLFDSALQLNPSSPDAYRDRAEALRLEAAISTSAHELQAAKSHLAAALESATAACELGNYRQPGSLRTLAEITHDLKLDDSAADYAEKAYACSSLEDRPVTQKLFMRYYARVAPKPGAESATPANSAGGTGTTGLVAVSRGAGDDDEPGTPVEVRTKSNSGSALPPGFIFRAP